MFCVYCGANNPEDAIFCRSCGKRQPTDESKNTIIAIPDMSMSAGQLSPGNTPAVQGTPPGSGVPIIHSMPASGNMCGGQATTHHPAASAASLIEPASPHTKPQPYYTSQQPYRSSHPSYHRPSQPQPVHASPHHQRARTGHERALSNGLKLTDRLSRRGVLIGLVGGAVVVATGGAIAWNTISKKKGISFPDVALGTTIYTYRGHSQGMRALVWSPDGNSVASASDDFTAQVWGAITGDHAVIYRGHSSYVEGVAWSPDSSQIVSGSADGTAQIWDASTGTHISTYNGHIQTYPGSCCQDHPWVNRVSWSPDGAHIVSCDQTSDGTRVVTAQVWDAKTGKTLLIYRGHTNGIYALAWSPDGTRIASAGYDGKLQIWNTTNGNTIATYTSGGAYLFGLSWSPDGTRIAVGSSNNTVLIIDAANGNLLSTYSGHSAWVKDVAWSPDGTYIASGSDDSTVRIWSSATGENHYTHNGQVGHINGVSWAPDSKHIASGGDAVEVWLAV